MKSNYHFATLWVLCLAMLCALADVRAQSSASGQRDELLISIPSDQIRQATQSVSTPLRFYQRFVEMYVAGSSVNAFRQLSKAGINATVLDDRPWSESYAIVTAPPLPSIQRAYGGVVARVLYSTDEFDIIKGSPAVFELLRERGLSCVEIRPQEIPVDLSSTYLPERIHETITDTVATIIARVSDSVVTSYIQTMQNFVTRHWSKTTRDSVTSWLRQQFIGMGLVDVAYDSFQHSGTPQRNVIGTIGGGSPLGEIIVGGHYDSYNGSNQNQAPGADDNASGTAAALEMARVLMSIGYQPSFTLRFIGFGAEEAGLIGSAIYAQRARQANRDIKVMMNYDMIGYRNQSQPDRDMYIVWYTGSEAFSNLHAATARAYTTLTPIMTTSYRSSSDSWSFYQQAYKTLFCIERDFNPYYHSANDLLQYIDIPYATEIIKAGLAMLVTLDQLPPSVRGLQVLDKGNGTTLVVSWDSVQALDLNRYKVFVGRSPGVYDTSYLQTGRTRTITGLTDGTQYYIGVSMVDLVGREGIILEESATPRVVPLPPAGFTCNNVPEGVKMLWRKNREMDLRGYNIYRSANVSGPFTKLNALVLADTTWTDTSSSTVPRYYFATAIDSTANESAPSDTVMAQPTVGIAESSSAPREFRLHQNYPNPFNPTTVIEFEVPAFELVTLTVFDLLGREVATLVNQEMNPGRYEVAWNARGAASGVYYYTLKGGGNIATMRMILMK